MGRRKVSMGLIPTRRVRVGTFGKRKDGLKKKAEELSVLCGVDVALVVASADVEGAAPEVKWESKEGVLARYRALAPEARARHTHRAYLEAELGKGEAKLARVRQGGPDGLSRWDKALDGVATEEEAQRLLDAVDAALRATQDRRRALGMPVEEEDGGVLEGIQPLNFAAVDDYLLHARASGNAKPLPLNFDTSNDQTMWSGDGFHHQGNAMQPDGYGFHQYSNGGAGMEGYQLQMAPDVYGNGDNGYQNGYGFQCAPASYFGSAQPNLAMWNADEPCLAMVPVEYNPSGDTGGINYADTAAAHGGQGIGGGSFAMGASGNFVSSPPALSLATGTTGGSFNNTAPAAPSSYGAMGGSGDNFADLTQAQPLAVWYGGGDMTNVGRYAAQWQAQRAGGDQKDSVHELRYLNDLEGTQLHLWGD